MADEILRVVAGEREAGRRLDAALDVLLPGMGLRGRRRACEQGLVRVDGKVRARSVQGSQRGDADPERRRELRRLFRSLRKGPRTDAGQG